MGEVLAHNMACIGRGEPHKDLKSLKALQSFKPQRHVLALISLGDKRAFISHPRWSWLNAVLPAKWIWQCKDRIDRRWMRMYQEPTT
jgi:hypothetical protein